MPGCREDTGFRLFIPLQSRHPNGQAKGINILPRAIAFNLRKFVEDSTPASPVYENGNYIVKQSADLKLHLQSEPRDDTDVAMRDAKRNAFLLKLIGDD
jgi:hypothetical protein